MGAELLNVRVKFTFCSTLVDVVSKHPVEGSSIVTIKLPPVRLDRTIAPLASLSIPVGA